jgi:hypothetical protein
MMNQGQIKNRNPPQRENQLKDKLRRKNTKKKPLLKNLQR